MDQALTELTAVFDTRRTDARLPSAMPGLADIFAWALHLEAVPDELPVLAQAVLADRVDGANPRSRGEVFLEENQHLLRRLDAAAHAPETLTAADRVQALEVFDRAGIGWEPLREEAGSDLIIRTATSAAAVMTTVADSDRSGLTAAKPVTRALRGGMLLPYWAIWGLTSRQAVPRGLALLGFALGGVALTLALFGVLSSGLAGPAAALGAGAVLAAFAYGALRTGSLLHSIVLLTPLIPLAAYASTVRDSSDTQGISTLVIAIVLALSLMLLGSIGVATGSVWAAIDRLADRYGLVRTVPRPGKQALSAVAPWGRRSAALLILVLRVGGVLVALAPRGGRRVVADRRGPDRVRPGEPPLAVAARPRGRLPRRGAGPLRRPLAAGADPAPRRRGRGPPGSTPPWSTRAPPRPDGRCCTAWPTWSSPG